MPETPWRTFRAPNPNGDFVALLSYLPLKSYWGVFRLPFYAAQVVKQLATADGLVGYSLLARPLSGRYLRGKAKARFEPSFKNSPICAS